MNPPPDLRAAHQTFHVARPTRAFSRLWDSELMYSFRRSPVTVVAAVLVVICVGGALLAPWIAPHDPFDLAQLSLLDAFTKPVWLEGGKAAYLLGTDNQGRDVLSAILYG